MQEAIISTMTEKEPHKLTAQELRNIMMMLEGARESNQTVVDVGTD